MSGRSQVVIRMMNAKSSHIYVTSKNRRNDTDRLELK